MTTRTATVKPVDDQPFDFNLNAAQAETELKPFRFVWATKDNPNRRFTMQHLEALNVWPLASLADAGDLSAAIAIFKAALGEEWDDFQAVPMPRFKVKALFESYQKHCGLESGESQASSDS